MTVVKAQVDFDAFLCEKVSPNGMLGFHKNYLTQAATCSSSSLQLPHVAVVVSLNLSRLSKIGKVLFLG